MQNTSYYTHLCGTAGNTPGRRCPAALIRDVHHDLPPQKHIEHY